VTALEFSCGQVHIEAMAARDRYTINLKCPKCEKTGEAHVSEDDYPYMRDARFRVDSVSEGFKVSKKGNNAVETEFICVQCGEIAG
jgi:hypothetical protein